MKFLKLLLVSLFIITVFSACKKNSQVEEPVLTGCAKHAIITSTVSLIGKDEPGATVEFLIDTLNSDTGLKYYWQLPDGSISVGASYKINKLNRDKNKGTYYGYYMTADGCSSYKNSLELKVEGPPCDLELHDLTIESVPGFRNVTMPLAYGSPFGENYKITCGVGFPTPIVSIVLNVSSLQEGEYKMLEASTTTFPSGQTKYAIVNIKKPNVTDYWHNTTQASMHIVLIDGKFELFICEATMEHSASNETNPITMRLRVN